MTRLSLRGMDTYSYSGTRTNDAALSSGSPPSYSLFDPNMAPTGFRPATAGFPQVTAEPTRPTMPMTSHIAKLEVQEMSAYELLATTKLGLDRALFLHTTGIYKSTLDVRPDINRNNTSWVSVQAKIKAKKPFPHNRCFVTMDTVHDVYGIHVSFEKPPWDMYQPHCQFTVYMPLAYGVTHPGIRAESENCGITMKQLDNVHFGFLDLQTSGYSTKLSSINCDKIRVRGHDTLITTNRVAAKDLLDIETTNFPVILKNTQSAKVRATTRNSSILLKGVSGGRIEAETKDAKIHSDRVVCNDLVLKTSNAKVAVEATSADLMQIVTSNSSIKGAWTIGNMLTLTTSNSKIEGTVQLKNPSIQASMFFHTSNGKISIRLPAISFRGGFDATTTHAEAQILRDSSNPLLPPVRYTVDSKNRKQGTVGEPHEHRHALMANTSNAKIAIALNGPDPLH